MRQQEKKLTSASGSLDYLLYLPDGYGMNSNKRWPLVLFLHGAGERGSDLTKVLVHGIPKLVEKGRNFEFVAISPQCPDDSNWGMNIPALSALLDEVEAEYQIDSSRIYVTGLSMGGYGTWALCARYPKRFAAAVPICGGGDASWADRIKSTPLWVFHGAKDDVVPISNSETMVEAVKQAGGDVRFTVYPEANHDSWSESYDSTNLYEWMLSQTRKAETGKPQIAVITGRHPYDVLSFHKLMHDMDDVDCHIQTLEEFLTDTADSQTAYDALCFYNFHNTVPDGSGEWWQGDMLKAVEKVRFSARGIVVVHHALGAFREWSVWSDLVGIGDRSFGWFTDQTLKAEVVDTSHPITQGLKSWELTDETYTMAEPGAGTRVLVKTDHPNSMKTLAWTRSYEGLRVACCVLGHDAKAYTNPGFRTLLNRSLLWTAGRI